MLYMYGGIIEEQQERRDSDSDEEGEDNVSFLNRYIK